MMSHTALQPVTEAEPESDFNHTKDAPYLALTGELWGVFCEDLREIWPRYGSTALRVQDCIILHQ